MVATTVRYGAVELKESAQRFWFIGFIISLALHSIVLSAFHLDLFHVGTDPRTIVMRPFDLTPRIHLDPWVPGITTPPPQPEVRRACAASVPSLSPCRMRPLTPTGSSRRRNRWRNRWILLPMEPENGRGTAAE